MTRKVDFLSSKVVVVQLFGVRGSISAPLRNVDYREKIIKAMHLYGESVRNGSEQDAIAFWKSLPYHLKYVTGSDTTCVTVRTDDDKIYVLDLGTGSRNVGDQLVGEYFAKKEKKEVNVMITHTHWDHIQGLPFFKPVYFPDFTLKFFSPYADLKERLLKQQQPEFFPVTFESTGSHKEFSIFYPGDVLHGTDDLKIECHPLRHPGGSFAYKFTQKNGKKFIFATDAEFTGQDMQLIHDYASFFEGADLLVLDTQYTLDESFSKFDWGHTSYTMAVNCASTWKIKNLVLTHHEPAYSDEKIHEIFSAAEKHRDYLGNKKLKIHLGREGLRFRI